MTVSDHYRSGMTERLIVTIVTVDPPSGTVEGVGKDAAVIQINVTRTPAIFRWPVQGEYWSIIRENGEWALEECLPNPDNKQLSTLAPGEAIVQAETIWTPSGEKLIRTGASAGGVLNGTYPNPGFAIDMATQAELEIEKLRLTALESSTTSIEARVYNSVALSILTGTLTSITFNSENYDNGNLHSTSVNTGRLTAPVAGLYEIGGSVQWQTNATNQRQLRITSSVGGTLVVENMMALTDGNQPLMVINTQFRLIANEFVTLDVYQNSGSTLNIEAAGFYSPAFWMARIRP